MVFYVDAGEKKSCEWCDEDVYSTEARRLPWTNKVFCSFACANRYQNSTRVF